MANKWIKRPSIFEIQIKSKFEAISVRIIFLIGWIYIGLFPFPDLGIIWRILIPIIFAICGLVFGYQRMIGPLFIAYGRMIQNDNKSC